MKKQSGNIQNDSKIIQNSKYAKPNNILINNENVVKNYKDRQRKMAINTYLSMTIINVNGVKAAIKRHMMADWITRMYNHTAYKRPTLGQKT